MFKITLLIKIGEKEGKSNYQEGKEKKKIFKKFQGNNKLIFFVILRVMSKGSL